MIRVASRVVSFTCNIDRVLNLPICNKKQPCLRRSERNERGSTVQVST